MKTDRATETDRPLAGRHVLVTRPAALVDALVAMLVDAGASLYRAPLLRLEPIPESPALRAHAQELDRYDILIVTSRNAVHYGMPLLARFWPQWPVAQRWLAIGAATAAALATHGIDATAPADARSEGLLALTALRNVAGRRVLLITGEGGRELLEETLAARGATVSRLAVYRRIGAPDAAVAINAFRDILVDAPDGVGTRAALVTSSEALQNLLGLAPWLPGSDVRVVVASERIAAQARAAGITNISTAQGADDTHMVAALRAWACGARNSEDHA